MKAMILNGAAFAMLLSTSTGCASLLGGYPSGFIYDASSRPHPMDQAQMTGPARTDDKQGEACSMGILSAVSLGDASLAAAKKAGGITDVHSVDLRTFGILGVYTQGCTVVHGK
jgi:hypothetical protein